MDAQEILKRYATGQRDFSRVSLIQLDTPHAFRRGDSWFIESPSVR